MRLRRRLPKHVKKYLDVAYLSGNLLLLATSFAISQQLPVEEDYRDHSDQAFAECSSYYQKELFIIAQAKCEEFLSAYPQSIHHSEARWYLAESYFKLHLYPAASREYSTYIKEYPFSSLIPRAFLGKGICAFTLHQYGEAITFLKSVLDKTDDEQVAGEASYWIAESFSKQGEQQTAFKYYLLAFNNYSHCPQRREILLALGDYYYDLKDFPHASEFYHLFVEENPETATRRKVRFRWLQCLLYAGKNQELIDTIQVLEKYLHAEELAGILTLNAEAYYRRQQYENAEQYFRRALSVDPTELNRRLLQYSIAWCFIHRKEYEKAKAQLIRIDQSDDSLSQAAEYLLAQIFQVQGNQDSAFVVFEKLAMKNNESIQREKALLNCGMIAWERGEVSRAKQYLRSLLVIFPTSETSMLGNQLLAKIYYEEGDYCSAQAFFDSSSSELHSTSATIRDSRWNTLLCSYFLKDDARIAENAHRFCANYPNDDRCGSATLLSAEAKFRLKAYSDAYAIYDSLSGSGDRVLQEEGMYGSGWCVFKNHDYRKSIISFTSFMKQYPQSKHMQTVRILFADACFLLQEYVLALGSYRSYQRTYPEDPYRDYLMYQSAYCAFQAGDVTDAYRTLESLITTFPQSPLAEYAQLGLAHINSYTKELREAIKEYQKYLERYPFGSYKAFVYRSLVEACSSLQRYQDADRYRSLLNQESRTVSSPNSKTDSLTSRSLLQNYSVESLPLISTLQLEKEYTECHLIPFYEPIRLPSLDDHDRPVLQYDFQEDIHEEKSSGRNGLIQAGIDNNASLVAEVDCQYLSGTILHAVSATHESQQEFKPNIDRQYYNVRGFIQSGDNRVGSVDWNGSYELSSHAFKWYGSQVPGAQRKVVDGSLKLHINNLQIGDISNTLRASYQQSVMRDSTALTRETIGRIDLGTNLSLLNHPVQVDFQAQMRDAWVDIFGIACKSEYQAASRLLVNASIQLFWFDNGIGNTTSLCPSVDIAYQINEQHRLIGDFSSRIEPVNLGRLIKENQYLSASAGVTPTNIKGVIELGLCSEWTSRWQSKVSIQYSAMEKYPYFSDSNGSGVWNLTYGGETRILTFLTEMVAKLTVNDYFCSSIQLRSSEDSFWGKELPYFPLLEAGCRASHEFGEHLTLEADAKYVGNRNGAFTGNVKVSEYVLINTRVDYRILETAILALSIKNLMNSTYERWLGYQELPRTISASIQIQW
jgi:TolA-binding protein